MADEKTTPTPKVAGARADTMHSKPETPDRSKGEGADPPPGSKAAEAPAAHGSVGSERPHKTVIPTENTGTLVEDIPDLGDSEPSVTNVPNPAPEGPLALQPGESLDTDTRKSGPDRGAAKRSKTEKKDTDK